MRKIKLMIVFLSVFYGIHVKAELINYSDTIIYCKKDYKLYTLVSNALPLKSASVFWLVPKDLNDRFQLKASNSKLIAFQNEIKIYVIPIYQRPVKLSIIKNDTLVDEFTFKVMELKKTKLLIRSNNKTEGSDSLLIKFVQPDSKVLTAYPKDCRYLSDTVIFEIKRKSNEINSVLLNIVEEKKISCKDFGLKKGDRITVTAFNVKRINFQNMLISEEVDLKATFEIK